MTIEILIGEGKVLTGSLFNEPIRVVTVRPNGPDSVAAGLAGRQTERFRQVTLTTVELAADAMTKPMQIREEPAEYRGQDG